MQSLESCIQLVGDLLFKVVARAVEEIDSSLSRRRSLGDVLRRTCALTAVQGYVVLLPLQQSDGDAGSKVRRRVLTSAVECACVFVCEVVTHASLQSYYSLARAPAAC